MEFEVDGKAIELRETIGYKGMMLSGIPNMALTLGYTNASWTLKADLVAEYVCRLLSRMDGGGYDTATPQAPPSGEATKPFLDLMSGYVLRSLDELPKQGVRWPWKLHQNYVRDVLLIRHGPIDDEAMKFSRSRKPAAAR